MVRTPAKGRPAAMTRRMLLLWGVPALLGLAVVAIFVAIVIIDGQSDAERKLNQIRLRMTEMQVSRALGKADRIALTGDRLESMMYSYADDSRLAVYFDVEGLVERIGISIVDT